MAENYGTLEGTLDEHGMLSGEMSDRATLEGEIQFGNGGGGILDVFQNGQSVVQGRYAYVTVPTFLRELRSDDYHNTVTTLEIQHWNDKADTSDIPTALSQLDNDDNYVQDENYVHTDNNFTDEDKAAIGGIPENITDLSDVAVDNIQNGQVLKWDATQEKFVNADESGGGGEVTDVKVDGISVVDPVTGEADIDLTGKADKVLDAVAGDFAVLLANGNCANSGKSANDMASKAEMSVTTSGDQTTIQLKSGTSATVINQHQDISGKADKSSLGTAAEKDSTALIVVGSTDLAEAGAVREAIDSAVASSYHHAGTKTCAELVSSLLVRANEGNVYNMTDSGVTTADFIEGAGKPIEEGANVGVAKIAENTYKFDLLSGFIDTSNFIEKSVTSGFVKNDGSIDTNTYQQTEAGKGLSTNDYDNTAKGIVDGVTNALAGKVDKVNGKGLSTNDYDNTAKGIVDGVTAALADKVDKVAGKGLSTNDFTNEDKALIGQTLGNNTVLTTDKTPFLTRQTLNPTGFSGYVREKLVGASYAWNQLAKTALTYATVINNVTCTPNADESLTLNGTTNTSGSFAAAYNNIPIIAGHKYLMYALGSAVSKGISVYTNVGGNLAGNYIIRTSETSGNLICTIRSDNNKAYSNDKVWVCCIDLTLAFGSTIADYLYSLANNGGITKLRDMGFPIDKYTPYGYGLYSSKPSAKKVVGFNVWDGTYETGKAIRSADGLIDEAGGTLCISDYIPIVGGLNYYLLVKGIGSGGYGFAWYDSGKNYISGTASSGGSSTVIGAATSPSNARYIRFTYNSSYDGVSSICINISDTNKNGQYEPYSSTTYSLGNDELRGKFDLVNGEIVASGDVKESNGGITRNYGVVDLGTKNWSYHASSSSTDTNRFSLSAGAEYIADIKVPNASDVSNVVCAIYVASSNTTNVNGGNTRTGYISVTTGGNLVITDTRYTSPSDLKTALNGVYLIYEKTTPTTETSTPFADPMSMVGTTTEEYIDTRDIPCPVGAERQYMGQSEDIVEIPSSPQSDGKRVLISEVSGGKEQVYWDIPKLYYKEYIVQGDGTKTYGDLLAELKPYYETLSEDEKTYSKVMMRATSSGNECLTFVGNYWYSRMGVNASGLWLDQIDFQYNKYFKQTSGGSITEYTNTNAAYNVFALRVLTYTRAES